MRGRGGNALYKQLVENAGSRWSWSSRHSWQSWRDRYCKNSEYFDPRIIKYQKKKGITDQKKPLESMEDSDAPPQTATKRSRSSDTSDDPRPAKRRAEGNKSTRNLRKVGALKTDQDARPIKQEMATDPSPKATKRDEEPLEETRQATRIADEPLGEDGQLQAQVEAKLDPSTSQQSVSSRERKELSAPTPPTQFPGSFEADGAAVPKPKNKIKARTSDDEPRSDDDKQIQAQLETELHRRSSGRLYPSLENIPSPSLSVKMPGSFQVAPNTAQKPKPKVKVQVRPDDDDPFATSPSAPSEADHPSASRPIPKVTQRPFGGVVHYSSPPAKGRESDTESDNDDGGPSNIPPSWPPIRLVRKNATQSLPNIPTVGMEVAVTDARQQQHDPSPHHSSQQVLDKTAPAKPPVNAVASSSKVTLDGPTNETPAPRQNVQSIDLAAIEKQRRTGLRRRTSRKAELATKDKLSSKNLEKHGKMHRQIAHTNHRHSIAGTRPNMKADDLRVESLRRRALSSSNSSTSLAPAPLSLIPAKQGAIISGSTISSDELDLVATLGVQSAISILAQATHFSEEVVRGVWETTKSLKQSERVLLAMREAAQSAMHKALSMTDEDGRSMNVEVESAADATPSKMAMSIVGDDPGDHPPKVIRGRRQSPPFIYTPTRPGEQPDSPYVPPRSTRAAQAARRISKSRRSLAIEMESRRVSQTNKSATPEANSDEVHVHDVFRWDETHDELFLRACVDTEEELAELERQVDDDRVLREHFLRVLAISHPNNG